MTTPQSSSTRALWALALCFGVGVGMGLMVGVSEGWDGGGYRRLGPDSGKLALTVAAIALLYRLSYAISLGPGRLMRMGVGVGAYLLAAGALGLWLGGNIFAGNHVWMWGLFLVLGMLGVEFYRFRRRMFP